MHDAAMDIWTIAGVNLNYDPSTIDDFLLKILCDY